LEKESNKVVVESCRRMVVEEICPNRIIPILDQLQEQCFLFAR
jgi:hypothetical protein